MPQMIRINIDFIDSIRFIRVIRVRASNFLIKLVIRLIEKIKIDKYE